jgi:5-formyltetrahydrofolate cyclo-ligase
MLTRRLHLCKLIATIAATHAVIPGSPPPPPAPAPALDALRQQKKALRTLVRRQLRALPPLAKQQEDEAIQKHVLAADWFRNSQRVCAYMSCARLQEVETSKIMAYLLQQQHEFPEKKVYVPRIEDKESHMCMLHITNIDEDLVANSMNILEPTPLMPLGNPRANSK